MAPFVWFVAFLAGWNMDRWRAGLVPILAAAAVLTLLCLVTSNTPALTSVERSLDLSLASLAMNYLVKTMILTAIYSAGFVLGRIARRFRSAQRGTPAQSQL